MSFTLRTTVWMTFNSEPKVTQDEMKEVIRLKLESKEPVIIDHCTVISISPSVYVGVIKQAAKVVAMETDV